MTGIVIPDGGNIGSTSDTDAIAISSTGKVTTADSELNVKTTSHTFTVKGVDEAIGDSQSGTAPDTTDSDSGQFAVYNGATKLFGITEHGYVLKPNVPSFSFKSNPSKSGTLVYNFGTELHNIGSHYNNSNGKFTVPISGRYLFCAALYAASNSNEFLRFNVNGSSIIGSHQAGSSTSTSASVSGILELSAGDYVELHVGFTIVASAPRNFFSGHLIG